MIVVDGRSGIVAADGLEHFKCPECRASAGHSLKVTAAYLEQNGHEISAFAAGKDGLFEVWRCKACGVDGPLMHDSDG